MTEVDTIISFTLPRLNCLRCGYSWNPRAEKLPKVCPECKSPYWNLPRRQKKQNKA